MQYMSEVLNQSNYFFLADSLCQDIVLLKPSFVELVFPHVLGILAGRNDTTSQICQVVSSQVSSIILWSITLGLDCIPLFSILLWNGDLCNKSFVCWRWKTYLLCMSCDFTFFLCNTFIQSFEFLYYVFYFGKP